MKPEDKVKELVDKMHQFAPLKEIEFYSNYEMARQCVLIAVDEILNLYWSHNTVERDFWKEVKQKIENK